MHVEAVAVQTERCWSARAISPGERALLCDMMIAAVCGAELEYQQKVRRPHGHLRVACTPNTLSAPITCVTQQAN